MSDIEMIVKAQKVDFFGKLPTYLINDVGLSANALAAALYLESKPGSWQCRPFDVRKRFGWGDYTWRKVSRELKKYGLLTEIKHLDGTALKFEITWGVMAVKPVNQPPVDSCTLQKPTSGKSTPLDHIDHTNKDLINKKDNIVHFESEKNKISKDEVLELFDRLWEYYPAKKGKQKAYSTFSRLISGKPMEEAEALFKTIWGGLVGMLQENRWKREANEVEKTDFFISEFPHASTWFMQERWKDEYETDLEKFKEIVKLKLKEKRK